MGTGGPFLRAKRGRSVTLTTHAHLVLRLRMSRSYTSSPPSAFMACSGTALLFFKDMFQDRSQVHLFVPYSQFTTDSWLQSNGLDRLHVYNEIFQYWISCRQASIMPWKGWSLDAFVLIARTIPRVPRPRLQSATCYVVTPLDKGQPGKLNAHVSHRRQTWATCARISMSRVQNAEGHHTFHIVFRAHKLLACSNWSSAAKLNLTC
jgi:hypothetical protein